MEHNDESDIMVSVYCLAFNHEKYIRDTLEGIISQKVNFKYEVLVHDDASTDDTVKIIKEYAEKYPDVIKPIIQSENTYSQGIRAFDQYILPKMKGKYIASCEGDDYWCDKNKLQKQYDFLEEYGEYVACAHNTKLLDCSNGKERIMFHNEEAYDAKLEAVLTSGSTCFHTSSIMFRRNSVLGSKPQFYYTKSFADHSLYIFLILQGKIRVFPDVMSVYRRMTESSWTKKMNSSTEFRIKFYLEHIDMFKNVDIYTNGKYHDEIQKLIRERECAIAEAQHDYVKVYKEYRDVFDKMNFIDKIVLLSKVYCPFIWKFYSKHVEGIIRR